MAGGGTITQGEIRFIHNYVQFPRYGEKTSACVDVTVVILGPQFEPWSSGPVISKARIERLGATASRARLSSPSANEPQPTVAMRPPVLNEVTQGDCRDIIPLLPDHRSTCACAARLMPTNGKGHYPGIPEKEYPHSRWTGWTSCGATNRQRFSTIVIDPHVNQGVMSDYVLRTRLCCEKPDGKNARRSSGTRKTAGPAWAA